MENPERLHWNQSQQRVRDLYLPWLAFSELRSTLQRNKLQEHDLA
jgi:hypothetical protein